MLVLCFVLCSFYIELFCQCFSVELFILGLALFVLRLSAFLDPSALLTMTTTRLVSYKDGPGAILKVEYVEYLLKAIYFLK